MAVKMSGADFKAFVADDTIWPDSILGWLEDEEVTVNGKINDEDEAWDKCEPGDLIVIIAGSIRFLDRNKDDIELTTLAKRWLKKNNTVTLLVEVTRDNEDGLRSRIKLEGGKVLN